MGTDLPTTAGVIQQSAPGGVAGYNGLIASLTADGMQFSAVTYLPGSSPSSLAVTSNGIVAAGTTNLASMPAQSGYNQLRP